MNKELIMNPNQLVAFLEKPCAEFTKEDIKRYIQQNGIRMVNFMYPAGDGRLKTLNFVINNQAYLDAILTCGERVDGSSLFPFIEAGSSDLYVIPRFRTAFLDPFAEIPTLSMLCSFFNKDGEPLESSPEHTLHKACNVLILVYEYFMSKRDLLETLEKQPMLVRWSIYYLLAIMFFTLGQFNSDSFIYLQF